MTSIIIVALTPGVSRPLSIMNFECKIIKCNVSFHRDDNLNKDCLSITI